MILDDTIDVGRPRAGSGSPGTNEGAAWKLNSTILRTEAVTAFIAGAVIWMANDGSILWFLPLLLVPDISMVGYLMGNRPGAVIYNLVHNWTLAAALLGLGWWIDGRMLLLTGALLMAHVGMDRALGYGLKLPGGFQETHLGHIGKSQNSHE